MFRRKSRSEPVEPDALDDAQAEDAEADGDGRRAGRRPVGRRRPDRRRRSTGSTSARCWSRRTRAPSCGSRSTSRPARSQSVMLAGEEGALELRAFAAPRDGDLWSEVRPQIAADVAQHGGTATERDGRWGVELVCQMQVVDARRHPGHAAVADRRRQRRPLAAAGDVPGPPGGASPTTRRRWEDALAAVVVHRGAHADAGRRPAAADPARRRPARPQPEPPATRPYDRDD